MPRQKTNDTFVLEREGDVPLSFTGTQLTRVDSRDDTYQPRWTSITIWSTDSGRYVVDVAGETTVPGEHRRSQVTVCESAKEVLDTLYQRNEFGRKYLTKLALSALESAGAKDQAIAATQTKKI